VDDEGYGIQLRSFKNVRGERMTGIILAGGRSSRMGRDKSQLPWEKTDLLNTIIEKVGVACDDIVVVSNQPRDLVRKDVRVVADIFSGTGPMVGIHAGLTYARCPYAFVTACDMPYIVPQAIQFLHNEALAGWDIVVPTNGSHYEPMACCYGKTCLPVIETVLNQGSRCILDIFPLVRLKTIPEEQFIQFDADLKMFMNINTMEEYKRALNLSE
jgi:molybdopterin-guanine dinucleotide biosynthesis protein A